MGHLPENPSLDTEALSSASCVVLADDSLLNAWDRLLAIAVLYPAGNSRFRNAVLEWREAVDSLVTSDRIELEIGTDFRLAHCGHAHEPKRVERSRLYPILLSIGAERLCLPRGISDEDLHVLLKRLRESAQKAEQARDFVHADPTDLPACVELRLRSFSARECIQGLEDVKSTSEAASGSIAGLSTSEVQNSSVEAEDELSDIEVVDEVLENPHLAAGSGLARSIEDKLKASATELHRDLLRGVEGTIDPKDLAAQEPDPAPPAARAPASPKPGSQSQSNSLPPNAFDAVALQKLMDAEAADFSGTAGTDGEWISLLVQLLDEERKGLDPELLLDELGEMLSDAPGLQAVQVLLSALEDLVNADDAARVDRLFPLLFGLLAQYPVLQADVFVELMVGVGMVGQEMLWPHLANALLRGSPELISSIKKSGNGHVASLAPELRERVLPRFEACWAMVDGQIDPSLFQPRRQAFTSLYYMLLRSTRSDTAGNLLSRSFKTKAPAEPHASLLKQMGGYRSNHREYYSLLIQTDGALGVVEDLNREAAELARQELEQLPRTSRRHSELLILITAMTPGSPGPVDELLDRIQKQRRLLVLPAWPAAARREAARVAAERSRSDHERGQD